MEDDTIISLDKMTLLIKVKEEMLDKCYSINMVKELMNLYQKIIEVLSAKNDDSFRFYIQKVHQLLAKEEVQSNLSDYERKRTSFKRSDSFKISESTFSTFNGIKVEE